MSEKEIVDMSQTPIQQEIAALEAAGAAHIEAMRAIQQEIEERQAKLAMMARLADKMDGALDAFRRAAELEQNAAKAGALGEDKVAYFPARMVGTVVDDAAPA